MIGAKLGSLTEKDIYAEKDHFKAVCFILRSDETKYNSFLDSLRSSANRGRDEYPKTLTSPFGLLVRELGEYNGTNAQRPHLHTVDTHVLDMVAVGLVQCSLKQDAVEGAEIIREKDSVRGKMMIIVMKLYQEATEKPRRTSNILSVFFNKDNTGALD